MGFRLFHLPALAVAVLVGAAPLAAQTAPAPATRTTTQMLDDIRKEARKDPLRAAAALKSMQPEAMSAEDRATWVHLSRENAVRNADAALLASLKDREDPFALLPLARILLANGYINEGNLEAAEAELARLGPLGKINTRDQRRYWGLKTRIAQLRGDLKGERLAVENIMHELGNWASPTCLGCHDDIKNRGTVVPINVREQWFARRFVELMRQQGDAAAVKAAAEKQLLRNNQSDGDRLLLAFALVALGKEAEAEAAFRDIRWVSEPGKDTPNPRMIFAWP